MVRRLVRDAFVRSREEYSIVFVFLALVWMWGELGTASRSLAMVATLCSVAFLGPMLAFSRLAPKEVLLLPVSRRELWMARWFVALVVAPCCVVVAQCLGVSLVWLGRGGPVDLPGIALTATCAYAYAGALMCLLPASDLLRRMAVVRDTRGLGSTLHIGVVIAFGGGGLWPVLFYDRLPTVWADVYGGFALALFAGVALALAAAAYRPAIRAHVVSLANAPASEHASRPIPMLDDRFTSLPKLAWLEVTRTGAGLAFMLLIVAGGFVALDVLRGAAVDSADSLRDLGLLPFDGGLRGGILALFVGTVTLGIRDVDMAPRQADLLRASLRHWRTLPMSRDSLAGLLMARRLLGWLLLWAMLLAIQFVAFGPPASVRADVLACFAGLDALVFAAGLRWRRRASSFEQMAMVWLLAFAVAVLLREIAAPEGIVLFTVGTLAAGLALLIHRTALVRSETYLPSGGGGHTLSADMAAD